MKRVRLPARCLALGLAVLIGPACGRQSGGDADSLTGGGDASASEASDSSADSADTADTSASDGGESESGSQDEGGTKFDVPDGETGEPMAGCEKVDFLFVVDRSSSMSEKQALLTANFPAFIAEIEETLNTMDYQILVTDTDGPSLDCFEQCEANEFLQSCQNTPCGQHPEPGTCDATIGAGLTKDKMLQECGIDGPQRFLLESQTNLSGTFSCLANVGIGGHVDETQAQSVLDAVGAGLAQPGACNEAFVRDDAILVVVLISDEDDKVSLGTPADWKQQLVASKGGNEDAIVFLGLLGDVGVEEPVCQPFGDVPLGGAEDAPKLREFIESLSGGLWASVCEPDYSAFFLSAVEDIDIACENFVPEG